MREVVLALVVFCLAACGAQAAERLPGFVSLPAPPEGITADNYGNIYVSVGPVAGNNDQIVKVSPTGDVSVLATIPGPSYAAGLATDVKGNIYMARLMSANGGVFKVTPTGEVSKLPGTGQILGADGLAFDKRGNLYITEICSGYPPPGPFGQGGIWRYSKDGVLEVWCRNEHLTGVGLGLFPFPVGANGIQFYQGSLYTLNSDKCTVVRVPVLPDGSPGEPEVWATVVDKPEFLFYQHPMFPLMIDGLALDDEGNIYVAVASRCAIARINAVDKSQDTIAVYQPPEVPGGDPVVPLDAPLSLSFGTGKGERQSLFATASGMVGLFVPGFPSKGPGVFKVVVEYPGLPLP